MFLNQLLSVALLAILSTPISAIPQRARSDFRCGSSYGNAVCDTGLCCSEYGWCGSSNDHCKTGCQSKFGTCQTTTPAGSTGGKTVSPDGSCGGKKGYTCLGSSSGDCCSQFGWCGKTNAYCGKGCVPGFGKCNGVSASSSRFLSSSTKPATKATFSTKPATKSTAKSNSSTESTKASSSTKLNTKSSSSTKSNLSTKPATKASTISKSGTKAVSSTKSGTKSSTLSKSIIETTSSADSAISKPSTASEERSSSSIIVSSTATPTSVDSNSSSKYLSFSTLSSTHGDDISATVSTATSSGTIEHSVTGASITIDLSATSSSSSVAPGSGSSIQSETVSITTSSITVEPTSSGTTSSVPTSTASLIQSLPSSPNSAFPDDPMEDPTAFVITSTSALLTSSYLSGDQHSGSNFLRVSNSEPGGAVLRASAKISVQSSSRYRVEMWVRSRGSSHCEASVVIDGVTVASSGSNIPTGWTLIEGLYTNTGNANPLLEVVVSCPTAGQKMKRVVDENGVDLDALSMIYAALSSSSSVLSASSVSAASATASASSTCDPVLIDPDFEIMGPTGTSPDWTIGPVGAMIMKPEPSGTDTGKVIGTYSYRISTDSTSAESVIFEYLHPIKFCAGVAYHMGASFRSYWRSRNTLGVGCRVTGLVADQQVFFDRVGSFDAEYRYIGGDFTFPSDIEGKLQFKIDCPAITGGPRRGVSIDSVKLIRAAAFVTPTVPSRSTYAASVTYPSQWPDLGKCTQPTHIAARPTSCVQDGEWLHDGGFEIPCSENRMGHRSDAGFDYINSGLTNTVVHSGQQALKLTFFDGGGTIMMQPLSDNGVCEDRKIRRSGWFKTTVPGACRVRYGTQVATYSDADIGNGDWTQVTNEFTNPYVYMGKADWYIIIVCFQAATVYVDDLSYQEVPGIFIAPPTFTALTTLSTPVPAPPADKCLAKVPDGGFELAGATSPSPNWSFASSNPNGLSTISAGDAHGGTYKYSFVVTSDAAITQDLVHTPLIRGCPPDSQVVSFWAKNYEENGVASEGCQVTLLLNDNDFLSVFIGRADSAWKQFRSNFFYPIYPTDYTVKIRISCPAASVPGARRGVIIDDFNYQPRSTFTDLTIPERTRTYEGTSISGFPFGTDGCLSTRNNDYLPGCTHEGNWIKNEAFENECTTNTWDFPTTTGLDTTLSGVMQGPSTIYGFSSMRIVFVPEGGSLAIKFKDTSDVCAHQNYRYSFWAYQVVPGNCKIETWWGDHLWGTNDAGTGWTQTEAILTQPFLTMTAYTDFELRISCAAGGIDKAFWLDDVSLTQV